MAPERNSGEPTKGADAPSSILSKTVSGTSRSILLSKMPRLKVDSNESPDGCCKSPDGCCCKLGVATIKRGKDVAGNVWPAGTAGTMLLLGCDRLMRTSAVAVISCRTTSSSFSVGDPGNGTLGGATSSAGCCRARSSALSTCQVSSCRTTRARLILYVLSALACGLSGAVCFKCSIEFRLIFGRGPADFRKIQVVALPNQWMCTQRGDDRRRHGACWCCQVQRETRHRQDVFTWATKVCLTHQLRKT
jgi:hypothetical protein